MSAKRKLALVLHTHLPWVLNHGAWPHGENWLFEATAHCYLPLLEMLHGLGNRGMRELVTLTVSPVLAAQWHHQNFPEKFRAYLTERLRAAEEAGDLPLSGFWWDLFRQRWEYFHAIDGNLVRAFAELSKRGVLELGTCAATHAYLPLLHDTRSTRLSLFLAKAFHQWAFGQEAQGVWLPECAYRPRGPFCHPVTGTFEEHRPGIETFLEEAGFNWTVLDSHLLLGGRPTPASASSEWHGEVMTSRSLFRPAHIAQSSVVAFFRDPHTSLQVWSREHGYPGEERYLDFHKRHWPSGLKLWKVTHPKADLAQKEPYLPEATAEAVDSHAHHFVELVANLAEAGDGVVVAPFDTELFGHWWFEGVAFLQKVLEKAEKHPLVRPTTLSQAQKIGELPRLDLPEGSWGDGGDHRVWVNPATQNLWQDLAELEQKTWQQLEAKQGQNGIRSALAQELLLVLASDWPFLVTTQAAQDYALRRFACHSQRLRELWQCPALPSWVLEDAAFPDGLLLEATAKAIEPSLMKTKPEVNP